MISYWEHFIVTNLFVNPKGSTPPPPPPSGDASTTARAPGWIFFCAAATKKHTNSWGFTRGMWDPESHVMGVLFFHSSGSSMADDGSGLIDFKVEF